MKSKRFYLPVAAVLLPAVLLGSAGCVPQKYNILQSSQITAAATKAFTEYLDASYSDYELTEVRMMTGAKLGDSWNTGAYASNCASAEVKIGDRTMNLMTDLESGTIYSDSLNNQLIQCADALLCEEVLKTNFSNDFYVSDVYWEIPVENHDVPRSDTDVVVLLPNCLPASLREEGLSDYLEGDMDKATITTIVVYVCGDEQVFPYNALEVFCEKYPAVLSSADENGAVSSFSIHYLSKEDYPKVKAGELSLSDLSQKEYVCGYFEEGKAVLN